MEQLSEKKLTNKYVYWIVFVLVLGLVIFLSFYKLDVKYVDPWDEARHGVNAYEMLHGGSLIQNTYLRMADYYNLKPPMSMWCIMLSMKLIGDRVLALRCYSAVCYVLLVALAGLFAKKRYGNLESILAMLLLACNTTPFTAHMIRSGDADSLYVLFFTIAMLSMMLVKENVNWVYICGLCFSFAFLTKSFHAGMILAIGGIYLIVTKDILLMKLKHWIGFVLSVCMPILIWLVLRLRIDGMTFLRAMWETDVLGRTDGTLQNNIAPFSYYFSYYFGSMSGKTTVYLCALILCMLGGVLFSNKLVWSNRREYMGYILWFAVTFVGFSMVTNKLLWYVYPAMIPLLMGAGILLAKICKHKQTLFAVRFILAIVTACFVIYFVRDEIQTIDKQPTNEFQEVIKMAASKSGLRGCHIYVDYDLKNSTWSQQDVFIAEISGDYQCEDGGLMKLVASSTYPKDKGMLVVSAEVYQEYDDLYDRYDLIVESENYKVYEIKY